ncbi:MAG TPA: metallophosphoesterase [Balneolales bacterium]|nr:metallophosphoesterase [Balneolales bacterium]
MYSFDIIGDIHGHAEELIQLLEKLGYKDRNGFEHPTRRVLFLGDLIDRGPRVREVLRIVKWMTQKGSARVIMGNHEYNIICYYTKYQNEYLRRHVPKNQRQNEMTRQAFEGREDEWQEWLDWLKKLPLFFECEEFRAVHAAWDQQKINHIQEVLSDGQLTDDFLIRSVQMGNLEYKIVEMLLKGQELSLPDGTEYPDKDGHNRSTIRVKWWSPLKGKTYQEALFPQGNKVPDLPIPQLLINEDISYQKQLRPVFFGHYWLQGKPYLQQKNVACLDYSVANNGKLMAYRFDGEASLKSEKFVWISG